MANRIASSLLSSTSQLSRDATEWLDRVAAVFALTKLDDTRPFDVLRRPVDTNPPNGRERLFYVIGPRPVDELSIPAMGLKFVETKLTTSGDISKEQVEVELVSFGWTAPLHWQDTDLVLFQILAFLAATNKHRQRVLALTHPDASTVLADIVATGRARWRRADGPSLSWGGTRRGHIDWTAVDTEFMQIRLKLDDEADAGHTEFLYGPTPVWVDPQKGEIGLVDVGLPIEVVRDLLTCPRISISAAPEVTRAMEAADLDLAKAAAPHFGAPQIVTGPPTPVLTLSCFDRRIGKTEKGDDRRVGDVERTPLANLSFSYGEVVIPSHPRSEVTPHLSGESFLSIHRDLAYEAQAEKTLMGSGLERASNWWRSMPSSKFYALALRKVSSWPRWLQKNLPILRKEGWGIDFHRDFIWLIFRDETDFVTEEYDDGGPIDWLNLKIGVMIDGEYVDIIEPLTRMIREGALDLNNVIDDDELIEVRAGERRKLLIPKTRLLPYLQGLESLYTAPRNGETPALRSPFLLAVLARLLESETPNELAWQGSGALRDLVARLRDTATIPEIVIPDGFRARLRDFQIRGASWLKFLAENRLGGILADEMGLGKTIQALAFIAAEKANGRLDHPALVVVPWSLLGHWEQQANEWAPDLSMLVFHGADREEGIVALDKCDVVLTTYGTVLRDEGLSQIEWSSVLCDEAQLAKNPDTATANVLRTLHARVRFCLTGTPLENNLDELWAQYDFVVPGYLGDREAFHLMWSAAIEKKHDASRLADLAVLIRPFMLRRTKANVAPDLPKKIEKMIRVEMGGPQRRLYDTARLAMDGQLQEALEVRGIGRGYRHILAALTKMRQVCCDPRLTPDLPDSATAGSAKLDSFVTLVNEQVAGGHKLLVFSAFAKMLDLISAALGATGIAHVMLTGQTQDRDTVITRFKNEHIPVFLISLRAGGAGLDLSVADTVILYDGWWNPAAEDQAIDRAHRIGQTRPVTVYRLKTVGTIEDEMLKLKRRKSALLTALMEATDENADAETKADLPNVNEEEIRDAFERFAAAFGAEPNG